MEIVGRVPKLTGLLCEAFICQGYVYRGQPIGNANVVYVCFGGVWHKLVIDCGVIIWRRWEGLPNPWSDASEDWECPHVDVGAEAGVVGHYLEDLRMLATADVAARSHVMFLFDNGRRITINNENDRSAFQID